MYKAYDLNPVPDDELVGALNGLGAALVGTVMVLQPFVEKTNEPYELIEETTEIVLQATGDESVAEDVTSGESAKEEAGTNDGSCEKEEKNDKEDTDEEKKSFDPNEKPSSKVLADNMEKAGQSRPPFKSAAHHIVAGAAKVAEEARKILKEFEISINDAVNGVFLPIEKMYQMRYIITQCILRNTTIVLMIY